MKKPAIISIIAYAAKMLTMPAGTQFESNGQKVGRIAYTVRTCKFLINVTYSGRRTLRRRLHMSSLYQRFDIARGNFFGNNPIGAKLLDIVDDLHKRYPESSVVHKFWLFCLPF